MVQTRRPELVQLVFEGDGELQLAIRSCNAH